MKILKTMALAALVCCGLSLNAVVTQADINAVRAQVKNAKTQAQLEAAQEHIYDMLADPSLTTRQSDQLGEVLGEASDASRRVSHSF